MLTNDFVYHFERGTNGSTAAQELGEEEKTFFR